MSTLHMKVAHEAAQSAALMAGFHYDRAGRRVADAMADLSAAGPAAAEAMLYLARAWAEVRELAEEHAEAAGS